MNYRPHTTVILAMTADGKVADRIRSPARFGSATDKAHLETQISLVDGVIFGAGTLRAYGTSLPITNSKLRQSRYNRAQSPQPVHIVVSGSGKIDSGLKFFQQSIPRWLLTTKKGSLLWQNSRQDSHLFERILIAEISPNTSSFIWDEIFAQLLFLGINKLAILGGGELVASLLTIDAIDEIWLTICPVIFGGINTPTPVAGAGWLQSESIKLALLQVKQTEQEVFLHYKVV
jgi:5-amino-6-(5-phosphoribosylamino)uracil reductase